MKITWDTHSRPEPVSVGTWKLESRPLSWFRNWHRLSDEKTEAALSWFQPGEGENRPPTKIPEAYADGLTRDGHHRVHALKILGGDPDRVIPVWVLHPHEAPMQPIQAARTQAPPGGAIVNRQYLPGGRFLPRALLSIRAGILRRKTAGQEAAKAAAGNPRNAVAGEPEKMVAPIIAAVARGALAAAPRVAAGAGRAGAASGGGGGIGGLLGNAGNLLSMLPMPSPPARREEQPTQLAAQGDPPPMAFTEVVKPKLLAAGTERKTFKPRDVAKIEEAHGIAPEHRLPHSVNPDGTISTRLDDFYAWQDRLAERRLGREKLHQLVNDPGTTDEVKEHHVLQHVTHDARNILRHTSKEEAAKWYGESVRGWEAAMHHLFSRERPGDPSSPHIPSHPQWGTFDKATGHVVGKKPWMRLAKAVLAYTSGGVDPTVNARAAARIIKSAIHLNPNNPFGSLPHKNLDAYERWKEQAHKTLLLPKSFPLEKAGSSGQDRVQRLKDAWAWHERHGRLLDKAGVEPGFSAIEVLSDSRTGQPLSVVSPEGKNVPWPGITPQQLAGIVRRKEGKREYIPNLDADGNLQPKGFGRRTAAIKASNKRIANLIADLGGADKAADYLESRVPIPEIKKRNPGFSWSGEPADTHGLGSFIFGPKFGRFYANVSGNKDEFTLDKWMARLAYSYMGTVMDAKGDRTEGPRSVGDDRLIRAAFHRAAKHLNLPVADLQAVMWEMAQRVPNLFGVSHEQDDFKKGGAAVLSDHGFDPGLVEAGRGTPAGGADSSVGGGVPGDGPGRRGNSGRPRAVRRAKSVGAGRK